MSPESDEGGGEEKKSPFFKVVYLSRPLPVFLYFIGHSFVVIKKTTRTTTNMTSNSALLRTLRRQNSTHTNNASGTTAELPLIIEKGIDDIESNLKELETLMEQLRLKGVPHPPSKTPPEDDALKRYTRHLTQTEKALETATQTLLRMQGIFHKYQREMYSFRREYCLQHSQFQRDHSMHQLDMAFNTDHTKNVNKFFDKIGRAHV